MSDRWINWDQESMLEDFWNEVDAVDEERQAVKREAAQDEEIIQMHMRRLEKLNIDEGLDTEPYAHMVNRPSKTAKIREGYSRRRRERHEDDMEIIKTNWLEIIGMYERGMKINAIANEFGVSYDLLRKVIREAVAA